MALIRINPPRQIIRKIRGRGRKFEDPQVYQDP
jgi:hypothetical protein